MVIYNSIKTITIMIVISKKDLYIFIVFCIIIIIFTNGLTYYIVKSIYTNKCEETKKILNEYIKFDRCLY